MGDEEVPYRSPQVNIGQAQQASSQDEQDYSTLLSVQGTLNDALNNLYKDFNAFEILKTDTPDEAAKKLMIDILGKQEAYDILVSVKSVIDSAIQGVKQERDK